jgi:multidrug efflux system membrane fusion protein
LNVSEKSKRGFVVGGIAALVVAGLVVGFRGGKKAPPSFERPPAAVTLAVATARDVPVYMDEIGKTVAREMVTVSPQVTGRLVEIHFTDGGDVKKGDLLFTIDPRPFQAQLDAALATLAQQKAELDLARTQYKRYADLVVTKAVSQAEYDIRKNAVAVDEAQVKQAEAAVDTARLNLQYCTIRSPIDGRAGRRLVDIGNVVEANKTPLLTIQKIDPIYADFTVNQNELTAVQDNMRRGTLKVEVRLQDEDDKPLPGQLTFLDNAVADATGTVQLRATVDNRDRRLWPGRLVKVRLVLSTIKSAVLVPSVAPQMSAKGQFVYVVKDDSTAELRLVKTGQQQGDLVVIEEGVKPGEKVVVNGQLGVTPGGKVRDASAAPAAPAAPAAGKSAGGKP